MTGAYSDWLEERGSKWSRELDFNSVQKELHNNKCFSAMNESYCRGYCKKCSFSSPSEMQRNLLGMVKCLEKCFSHLANHISQLGSFPLVRTSFSQEVGDLF